MYVGERSTLRRVLGLADGKHRCGAAMVASHGDDVELVLDAGLGVVDHRRAHDRRVPADRCGIGESVGELPGQVFEVRAEDMCGEARLRFGPRLCGPAILETGQIASRDDVMESDDGVGNPVDRPSSA